MILSRRPRLSPRRIGQILLGISLAVSAPCPAAEGETKLPLEVPDNPPGTPARATAKTTASTITFGRFTSVQVNVTAEGANIVGDAANEPSIAVDPLDHDRMVIGWRQFDTISSNFRQAGVGYSLDGGASWLAGKINPGVFRSDPVLGVNSSGKFFYNSLRGNL